ncbi:LOW QUALITY PROTEIN: linker for activation of T-cells family member 2 [Callospermophilus lateralis]|uniref:LOW QUALITY PROTEIN: linker for activation of T-cells family member 2 n=1 Tax=Callospermophilus lateralis TaxID=76772 RepID=UPI00405493DB
MSAGTELLWLGAVLLLLLGTAAGLCVRCSRPGLKKAEKIYQQRSLQENRQSFAVARTYSLVRQPWPGPPTGMNPDHGTRKVGQASCHRPWAPAALGVPARLRLGPDLTPFPGPRAPGLDSEGFTQGCGAVASRPPEGPASPSPPHVPSLQEDKLLHFSSPLDDPVSPRYQNFSKGDGGDSDAAYIDPIAADYYNWGCSTKSPEDDDDAISYENVLICKPRALESDYPCVPASGEETEDYQNSASIHQWRESRRAVEQGLIAGPPCPAGSPEEDAGEPDYVNGDMTMAEEA